MKICKDCKADLEAYDTWAEEHRWGNGVEAGEPPVRPPATHRPIVPNSGSRCATHWRKEKARRKAVAHESRVQKTYGLAAGDYALLYQAQGGKCALCRRSTGARKKLAVDHDHETGLVYGLLCGPCNKDVMGWSRRDFQFFHRCIEYLRNPPARQLGIIAYHEENRG